MNILIQSKNLTYNPKFFEFETEYNKYFLGEENSIYNKRFGKSKILPREWCIFFNVFNKILLNFKQTDFYVLDFGCGNGRFLPVFEKMAYYLLLKNMTATIDCLDSSIVAINSFEKNLLNNNYLKTNHTLLPGNNCSKGYLVNQYKKDNLTINLIQGNAKSNCINTKKLLRNDYNIVMLMFGVLSHIVSREKRSKTLAMLGSSVAKNGQIIINVPTKKLFLEELNKFDNYRQNRLPHKFRFASETRDIYYQRSDGKQHLTNYYHLYTFNELNEDVKAAKLTTEYQGISSIYHPASLTNYPNICIYFDSLFSSLLSKLFIPNIWTESIGSYIFAVVKPNKK